METKQLNGYIIDFYSQEEWFEDTIPNENRALNFTREDEMQYEYNYGNNEYAGLVTEIPEELAEKIVSSWQYYESLSLDVIYNGYIDYKSSSHYEYAKYPFKNAKDSFKTLSNLPYCVITKK